jgi:hypothetical protein
VPRPELRALRDHLTPAAADDGAEDRAGHLADLIFLGLARLGGAVPQDDVTELVGHHAGDFAFGLRRLDHPAVDEHRTAGQRERVDLLHVHRLEGVVEFGMLHVGGDRGDQPPPDAFEKRRDAVVPQDRQLLSGFGRGLTPELDVLRGGVAVFRRNDLRLRADKCGRQHQRGSDVERYLHDRLKCKIRSALGRDGLRTVEELFLRG